MRPDGQLYELEIPILILLTTLYLLALGIVFYPSKITTELTNTGMPEHSWLHPLNSAEHTQIVSTITVTVPTATICPGSYMNHRSPKTKSNSVRPTQMPKISCKSPNRSQPNWAGTFEHLDSPSKQTNPLKIGSFSDSRKAIHEL